MVVFQKLEGKTTTSNFWNEKLEGKTTTLKHWIKRMGGNSITPKNCVLTNFLHERRIIFLLVFSLIRFWILLRNVDYLLVGLYISLNPISVKVKSVAKCIIISLLVVMMSGGGESQYSPIIGDVIEPPSYMVNLSELKP